MCKSSNISQKSFYHSISGESLLSLAADATKGQPSGNEEGSYLAVDTFSYEQGESSGGVRGLRGGTVLKERKAKMEGS